MSVVYEGDSWKSAADEKISGPSRAAEQRRINGAYARGEMTREEWSRLTDELGDVSIWSAAGRLKA